MPHRQRDGAPSLPVCVTGTCRVDQQNDGGGSRLLAVETKSGVRWPFDADNSRLRDPRATLPLALQAYLDATEGAGHGGDITAG